MAKKQHDRGNMFDGRILAKERVKQGFKSKWSFAKRLAIEEPKISSSHVWQWEKNNVQPSSLYWSIIAKVLDKPREFFLRA